MPARGETTVFVSGHQLDQIARTCDRVGVGQRGEPGGVQAGQGVLGAPSAHGPMASVERAPVNTAHSPVVTMQLSGCRIPRAARGLVRYVHPCVGVFCCLQGFPAIVICL
ncbi:hypothetical protein GCM10007147_34060 [Nocardiopsis kunsanensis]|uniref:Uncharacterized protein n=1 Tax=Nocardiopsis kunsanensis TaxID=141693 RepID=A0A919CKM9_9ACTN|nr:hypothetical protein GCM10007147_34060 [Nocardiopsis kunsanensis]